MASYAIFDISKDGKLIATCGETSTLIERDDDAAVLAWCAENKIEHVSCTNSIDESPEFIAFLDRVFGAPAYL